LDFPAVRFGQVTGCRQGIRLDRPEKHAFAGAPAELRFFRWFPQAKHGKCPRPPLLSFETAERTADFYF